MVFSCHTALCICGSLGVSGSARPEERDDVLSWDGSSACAGGPPHPSEKCIAEPKKNAEKSSWSILCLFTGIYFALEMRSIYSLKNGQFAFFSLHEHWSGVCESTKGALVGIERAIKTLILSSRRIKYSDQTSNCMSCYNNVNY